MSNHFFRIERVSVLDTIFLRMLIVNVSVLCYIYLVDDYQHKKILHNSMTKDKHEFEF